MARIVAIAVLLLSSLCAMAQDERPVTSFYGIETGSMHLHDSYLSPLKYSGWTAAPTYRRAQAMKCRPQQWMSEISWVTRFGSTTNPAHNANIYCIDMDAGWSPLRKWHLGSNCLAIGPATDLRLGMLFSTRNGNNPVSVLADWTVGVSAHASHPLSFGRFHTTIAYDARLDLTGVFFRPHYGESYYEIYLGNHRGLAHAAWPGNYRNFSNRLCATFHFSGTSVTAGYRFSLHSSKAGGLLCRMLTHSLVIGLECSWLSVNRSHDMSNFTMPY